MDLPTHIVEGLTSVGGTLLVLVVTIDAAREGWAVYRGASSVNDLWVVVARGALFAFLLVSVPWISRTVSTLVLDLTAAITGDADVGSIDKILADTILQGNNCELGGLDVLRFAASPAGIIYLLGVLAGIVCLVVKFFVIDVLWPINLAMTLYLGIISLPLAFLREMGGGAAHYARQIGSIALWPIAFALLCALMAGAFPNTIRNARSGLPEECLAEQPTEESTERLAAQAGIAPDVEKKEEGYLGALKFLALCMGLIAYTLGIPSFCGSALGAQMPNMIGGSMFAFLGVRMRGKVADSVRNVWNR